IREARRKTSFQSKLGDLRAVPKDHGGRKHEQCLGPSAGGDSESAFEIIGRSLYLERLKCEPYRLVCRLHGTQLLGCIRFGQYAYALDAGQHLFEEFEPFRCQLAMKEHYAGDVRRWPREAQDVAKLHWVIVH